MQQTTIDHKKRGPKTPPFYCPIKVGNAIKRKQTQRNYRMTECGVEKKCSACQEFWPADTEFFSPNNGVLHCQCKACQAEYRRLKDLNK